jgi:MFS family permease
MNKPKVFYGWYMVAASWIMLFLINAVAMSIFFKPMLEDFGWDRATLSSVQSVSLIVFTFASPFLGRLIDKFGPRIMITICVITQTLSSLINGIATNIGQLYLARFLYQVKSFQSTQVLISRWFSKKRGLALGIVSTGLPIGTIVLTPISQLLIIEWGWRVTMLFWAAVTLVVALPFVFIIRNYPAEKGLNPDGETAPDSDIPDNSYHRQIDSNHTTREEVSRVEYSFSEAIKNRTFWFMSCAHFICGLGCGFIMTHIVIFTTDMGYSAMIAASIVSVQGFLNLVGVLTTGYMSDRMARKKVLAFSHFVRSLSFVICVFFIYIGGQPLLLLYVAAAFFGFGWFTTAPLQAGLTADIYGNLHMGTILGSITAFHMLGMAIGAYAGGAIFELTGSYLLFFAIQGPMELLAVVLVLSVHPLRNSKIGS